MERATAETCMAYVPSTTRIILETYVAKHTYTEDGKI